MRCRSAAEYRPFLDTGALDELQPDIAICGALTGVGQVVVLADLYDRPLVPHGRHHHFHGGEASGRYPAGETRRCAVPFPISNSMPVPIRCSIYAAARC
ncbi:enolase C-terminal domain-like protein [Chelatococcus sp. GCM10030263]|uniref:enolase C-terminal domain-like protein n=1 Tax=Chelatococcus sp. GCM10030263 TaxID=3273387 RepID=UPI0036228B7F